MDGPFASIVQFIQAQQQARHLELGATELQHSVELVVKQFEGGIADFNRVYTTQTQLVAQQDQLASTRGNIVLYLIQVYRALGGGWEAFLEGNGMPILEGQTAPPEDKPATEPRS